MAVTFSEQSTTTFPQPASGARLVFIDADGDGDTDILYQTGANGTPWQYARSNGDGTYTILALGSSPFAGLTIPDDVTGASFHVLDFDGDGDMDVWGASPNGSSGSIFVNNGAGAFSAGSTATFPAPGAGSRVITGDFDNDGDDDILYQTGANGTAFAYSRSNGDGSYTSVAIGSSPFAGLTLPDNTGATYYLIDYDNDGDDDVWAAVASSTGSLFRNNGDGSFSSVSSATMPTMLGANRAVVGDFDSDGDDDILYQTGAGGSVFQYARNDGSGSFTILSQAQSPFAGATLLDHVGAGNSYVAADVDGDGDVDIYAGANGTQGEYYLASGKPPEIASSTPSDNGTGVNANATITITFDESVSKGSGDIYLYRGDGTLIETISVNSAQVSGSGTTWTIDPSVTMAGLTNYYVLFEEGTFVDADGSIFFGVDDPTVLNFTTAATNTAPTFTNLNGDAPAFTEDAGAVRLDVGGNATVADAEQANFNGGTLTVAITAGGTAAQDVLSVAHIGNGAGQIGVSGANISYSGVQIATFTGGTGGTSLTITLDPDATPAATQALVRALQYNNTNSTTPSTSARTVTVILTDGAGGTSTTQTLTVSVTAQNDAAVVVSGDTPAYTEGGAAVAVSPNLTITDVDSANMTGATITVTDFVSGDVLTFVNQNGISGSYNSGTGVLTLSGAASVANYQAALRSITYSGAADANVGGTDLTRTISFSVTDGVASNTATSVVTIADGGPGPGDDNVPGTAGDDSLSGFGGEDVIDGGDGNDYLDGGDSDDELLGGDGDDYLKGGTGADNMLGGTGDDFYVVDNLGDTPDETGGDGTDTVQTRVNWTLGAGFENLNLGNGGAINGTGNEVANVINGNSSANTIMGMDDNDTLSGGGGDDSLYGGNGVDSLDGGLQNDFLDGGDGDDTILGGGGNDYLRGGAGADHMEGGAGNDFYAVEDAGDTVSEAGGSGIDEVWSRIDWTLGTGFENLTLGAAGGDTDGTGNALRNVITGNHGANVLHGLGEIDTLIGDGGDDTLYGDEGNDILNGGTGYDTLLGGTGSDRMTGGQHADTFVFTDLDIHRSTIVAAADKDQILDLSFTGDHDVIDLSAIDADTVAGGDQAFSFVTAFTNVAGQATLSFASGITTLTLDVDGDGKADLRVELNGDLTGSTLNLYTGAGDANGGWVL